MRRLWHLACTARELHVRRSRSDSAILCLPEIRCTGHRGRVRRGHSETDVYNCIYVCTTLGLYLQRRDTRKYAQMYTGKVFVTAGRGDDAGRRESREAASQPVKLTGRRVRQTSHRGLRVQGTIGLGISIRARAHSNTGHSSQEQLLFPHTCMSKIT
jgi:hypothetical protein